MRQTRLPALRLVALAVLAAWGGGGQAVGLGSVRIQSALGQSLRANIAVIGDDGRDLIAACVKAKVFSSDGVILGTPQIGIVQIGGATSVEVLLRQAVKEPAVLLSIDIGCASPMRRDYPLLLDPPVILPAVAAPDRSDEGVIRLLPSPLESGTEAVTLRTKAKKVSARLPAGTTPAGQRLSFSLGEKSSGANISLLADPVPQSGDRLKLSTSLSVAGVDVDPSQREARQVAGLRFAAILRGEGELQADQTEAQSQVRALQDETARLRNEQLATRTKMNEARKSGISRYWALLAGALIVLSMIVSGWLWLRLRKIEAAGLAAAPDESASNAQQADTEQERSHVAPVVAAPGVPPGKKNAAAVLSTAHSVVKKMAKIERSQRGNNSVWGMTGGLPPLEYTRNSVLSPYAGKTTSLKVEEISDATQEAEFWMSINEPQRALDILESQGSVERPDSPVPWLYLLDIYREIGEPDKYETLRERLESLFNAKIPGYGEDVASSPSRSLEDFPHLMTRICELWRNPGIVSFLESLLIDDRDGGRAGLDLPVYRDILTLIAVARELNRAPLKQASADAKAVNLADPYLKVAEKAAAGALAARAQENGMGTATGVSAGDRPPSGSNGAQVIKDGPPSAPPQALAESGHDAIPDQAIPAPWFGTLRAWLTRLFIGGRRNQSQHPEESVFADSSSHGHSLFGETGGASVDTNDSVFDTNFGRSVVQFNRNEVDPIAEAEVYIAYGRDIQAEEILQEAMRVDPDRHAILSKLLEIYADRKDLESFELLASDLYRLSNGEGNHWDEAERLGFSIDPGNNLYAGGANSEAAAASRPGLIAPTLPMGQAPLVGKHDFGYAGDFSVTPAWAPVEVKLTAEQLIHLDLDLSEAAWLPVETAASIAAGPQMTGLPAPDLFQPIRNFQKLTESDLDDWNDDLLEHTEMDTKLDLIVAYQEMGDRDGARELIDEVIRGGSAEQIEKAKVMRMQLVRFMDQSI